MADISIGSAVGAGFQLITRKPLTVLAWGFLRLAYVGLVLALIGGSMLPIITQAMQQAASGASSDAAASTFLPQMLMMQGGIQLANLLGLVLSAVILCAVARSQVHPERGAFAYLRLGAPELYVIVLYFGLSFVLAFAIILFALPCAALIGFLVYKQMFAVAVATGLVLFLILLFVIIYVALRFSMVVPMMVDDGKFHLFDAWSLTKGKVGSLFGVALLLMLIAIALELVLVIVFGGIVLLAVGVAAGGIQNIQNLAQQSPADVIAKFVPFAIAVGVLAIPVEGALLAIFGAPWARAYRDLRPGDVSAVFAATPPAPTPPAPTLPPTTPPAPAAA